ncbi:MAG: hypothetical protein ACOH10_02675 [Rhodoglobus sp.]
MTDGVRLRPHSYLLPRGLAALAVFFVPVFGALYYITSPLGPWPAVLCTQIVATLIVGLAIVRYLRAFVRVDPTSISERAFFRNLTTFDKGEIGSVVLVNTSYAAQPDGVPQLFVRGHDGKILVRMRGRFWSRTDMDLVAATLDVPLISKAEIMSTKEILHEYPDLGYWYERRPMLGVLAFLAAIVATGVAGIVMHEIVGTLPRP